MIFARSLSYCSKFYSVFFNPVKLNVYLEPETLLKLMKGAPELGHIVSVCI